MTPACRSWLIAQIERLTARVESYRRADDAGVGRTNVVHCLDLVIADMRARLADAPAAIISAVAPAPAPHPAVVPVAGSIGWTNPVFWRSGGLNPFAGTRRDQLIASAETLRRLGEPRIAAAYDRQAAAEIVVDLSTPMPAPFVAGPQLAMF